MNVAGMTPSQVPPDSDARVRRVELLISNLLRTGVITSISLVVIGTVLMFIRHPEFLSSPDELQALTQAKPHVAHSVRDIIVGVLGIHGQALISVGLLVLIATPVMRVAVSIVAFIYQGDRVFTMITSVVLILLFLSFILGMVG